MERAGCAAAGSRQNSHRRAPDASGRPQPPQSTRSSSRTGDIASAGSVDDEVATSGVRGVSDDRDGVSNAELANTTG
jgi:hypothetical protein